MSDLPPVNDRRNTGRRQARRDETVRTMKKSRVALMASLIVFVAAAILLVLVTPKEPISRAYYTAGTESGVVDPESGSPGLDPRYAGLVISEIMASNQTSVPDEMGVYNDWVEIWNNTGHVVNLYGVGLSDRGDAIRFLFPNIDLAPDERLVVFCSDTNQTESGKPLHAKFKLSSSGETVYLFDPNAYLIDSAAYRILGSDNSWSLKDDGTFEETPFFSPSFPNGEAGYTAYLTSTMVTGGDLIINEIMSDAKSGLTDEDNEFVDWIELYNTTDRTISLDNYALTNKENKPLKWRFPDGAVVAPHSYYIVFCSGKDRRDDASVIPHANFKISAEHDTVVLSDSHGRVSDRVTLDNIPEDCSYARDPNGVFSVHTMATPGRDNSDIAGADYDLRQRNLTGVYITEVMASNDTTSVYANDGFVDWIEIYNSTYNPVDISGWGLSDNIGRPRRWQFPQGTILGANERMVVLCDGLNMGTKSTQLHTNFKIKRAGGEIACLSDATGHVLDKIVLPKVPTDVSYGRSTGMSGFFYYDTPTPFQENNLGFTGYADTPELTLQAGMYYGTVYVGFTVPQGTTVHYTTTGAIPTEDDPVFNENMTLELNSTTVLRARAFSVTGKRASEVVTGTYFINTYHSLPVVSLVIDPDELYNEKTGMFTVGPDVDKSKGIPFKNTVYRQFGKTPRPAHIEYYDLDGMQILDQGMEMSLMGAYSLDMPQKSMKLKAKSKYGAKVFNAKLFEDREYTEYKSLVLRNSGNDCVWTRLLDGFESRLLDSYGTQVVHQAWKPVVVYINGVYWGHMNLRERVDKYFVAQHEGLSLDEADDLTILEANMTLKTGSASVRKEYKDMIARIKSSNPAKNQADLQYILDNVDVDNYFEYIALEMFVGNSDIGNLRMYRLNAPGSKWRWIWYDADYGLFSSSFNSPASYLKKAGMGQQKIDNTILLKLMEVPEYKDKFLTKLGEIYQTLTTDYMLERLEPLVALIQPEMSLHFARWGELNDPAIIAEAPRSADGAYRYWEQRVERLRNTIRKRPNLLWGYIKDEFKLNNNDMQRYFGPRPDMPADAI